MRRHRGLACAATVPPSHALPLASFFVIGEKEKKNKRIIKKKKKKRYVLIPQQLSCNMVWFHCRVGGLARAYTSMCFQLLLVWCGHGAVIGVAVGLF